ncbi:MAG: hypothetical protein R3212_06960, partial [Xanthomonadales bacterium]|nr:hypothetical protein [Xanthomonadales bacterium]
MEQANDSTRAAKAFEPVGSPAVLNITTYRFGAGPEATRPDRVMRSPNAAILLLRKGRLYERNGSRRRALPRMALLGPSTRAQTWETAPNTRFTLVNLAPGVMRFLLGLSPTDVAEKVESLTGHAIAERLESSLDGDAPVLHQCLCDLVCSGGALEDSLLQRVRIIDRALREASLGAHVSDYADRFGITTRTLQRNLRAAVGLAPKKILGIERIRRLIVLTAGGWPGSVADLAQAGGYFDQSHLRYELQRYDFGAS